MNNKEYWQGGREYERQRIIQILKIQRLNELLSEEEFNELLFLINDRNVL